MIIDKYSFRYKLANKLAKWLLKDKTKQYYFSTKQRASCLVKIIFEKDGKVLLGKKIQKNSLAKVCLPYGYVDLAEFDDNPSTCVKVAFDKLNLELDVIDFEKSDLIDIKLDYENDISQVAYIYKYKLDDRDMSQISDSYSLYDLFLLDLNDLNEYNKKKRFVTDLDYVILKKFLKK